jgi:hypothetical protein
MLNLDFMPPSEHIHQQQIRAALEAYQMATRARQDSARALAAAERDGRSRAEREDAEAAADALAAGSPIPAAKRAIAFEKRMAELRRVAAASEILAARRHDELATVSERHAVDLERNARERYEEARAAWAAAIERAEELHGLMQIEVATFAWATGERWRRPTAFLSRVPLPAVGDYDHLEVADLFRLLGALGRSADRTPEDRTAAVAAG